MSGTAMGAGDWLVLAGSVGFIAFGLYQIVFATRIEAGRDAQRGASSDEDEAGGGYDSKRMELDPRTLGFILIGLGAVGILMKLF